MYKTTVNIDGMMCTMCESHINKVVREAVDVKSVKSSHRKNTAEIITESSPDTEAITRAINSTGYTVTGIITEKHEKKGLLKGLLG